MIEINNGYKGECRLEVLDGDTVISDTGWTENHITNHGMFKLLGIHHVKNDGTFLSDETKQGNFLSVCVIGTSDKAPTNYDEELGNKVAQATYSSLVLDSSKKNATRTDYHRYTLTATYVFSGIDATIKEVGVANKVVGGYPLNTRLTVPPTPITSDKVLRVTYRIKHFVEIIDKKGVVKQHNKLTMDGDTKDISYNLTQKPMYDSNYTTSNPTTGFSTGKENYIANVLGGGVSISIIGHAAGGIIFELDNTEVNTNIDGNSYSYDTEKILVPSTSSLSSALRTIKRDKEKQILVTEVTDTHCSIIDGIFIPSHINLEPFNTISVKRFGTETKVKYFNEGSDQPITFNKSPEEDYFFAIKFSAWRYVGEDED